jgi:hypothetical protein
LWLLVVEEEVVISAVVVELVDLELHPAF